jgi:spore coat polysaccharide biosynthesis predicted glycosyltransferase SpsG
MEKKNKIIFITSFNKKIGYGHYNRVLSIFDRVKSNSFILLDSHIKILNKKVLPINLKKPQKKFFKLTRDSVVIVDLPKINSNLNNFLKKCKSKKLVYFNDGVRQYKVFDINISILNSHNNKFSGKKFITLNNNLQKNKKNKTIDYLVTLGMSSNNFNLKLAITLNKLKKKTIYITNKKIKNLKYVKFIQPLSKKKFFNLLNLSHVIISAAGQTCLEALFLQKKILIFKTAQNQNNNIKFLNQNGFKIYNSLSKFLANQRKALDVIKNLITDNQKKIFIKNGSSFISNIFCNF